MHKNDKSSRKSSIEEPPLYFLFHFTHKRGLKYPIFREREGDAMFLGLIILPLYW